MRSFRHLALLTLLGCEPRRIDMGDGVGPIDTGSEPLCPALYLSTTSLSWPAASLDGADEQTVVLANLCEDGEDLVLVFSEDPSTSSAFGFDLHETRLSPGASSQLRVTFEPIGLGSYSGAVEVVSNAPEDATRRISLGAEVLADADGDGHDALDAGGEDCDDRDESVHPDAVELGYDGVDNNCDGVVDHVDTSAALGWLRGDPYDYLGHRQSLSVGDLSGDGSLDVLVGGYLLGDGMEGGLYLLDGAGADTWAGDVAGTSLLHIAGAAPNNYAGAIGPRQGDIDGDGQADLFVVASDISASSAGNRAAAVFLGPLTESTTLDQADLVFTGSRSLYSTSALSQLDLDGDGLVDPIRGDWYASYYYTGGVACFLGASLGPSGDYSLDWDADAVWAGANSGDALGCALGGGDLDGDGYDDLVITAPYADVGGQGTGSAYLISGGPDPGPGGSITQAYHLQLYGAAEATELGLYGVPQVLDLDGDEAMDLVVGSPSTGTVYAWLDAADLAGLVDTESADLRILGEGSSGFGAALAQGDPDGDGLAELVVGAPEVSHISRLEEAERPGELYIFTSKVLSRGTYGSAQAGLTIVGVDPGDMFGSELVLGDLDADGVDEILVAAPGAGAEGQGWLWALLGR